MLKAYKTELDPNNHQTTLLRKHAGAARWAYNFGLAAKISAYKNGKKTPSAIDLHKEVVRLKHSELPWLNEISKCAPQEALRNLDQAYKNFFRRVEENKKPGFPKFKSKRDGLGCFTLRKSILVYGKSIRLPRLGVLRLKEGGYLPQGIPIKSATVSEKAGHWFVSVLVDEKEPIQNDPGLPVVGVDLGIKTLATLSDGTTFDNPRPLKKGLKKIKRLQVELARRKKGSKNREKTRLKLARAHYRVGNIRKDTLHKLTTHLTKTKSVVMIENLNVSGMMKNHKLAQAIADVGFFEFKRQLKYKGLWYGCEIQMVDRFYPSTKTCSNCGNVREISLSDRIYDCPKCGLSIDRDLNAAINLKQTTVSSAESHACGESVRPNVSLAVLMDTGTRHNLVLES